MPLRMLVALSFLLWPCVATAAEPEPAEILRQMLARYERMESYSAEVKVAAEISGLSDKSQSLETTVSIRLGKPAQYRISWSSQVESGAVANEGAVWRSKEGPRLRLGNRYLKLQDDEMALAAATGVSHGAAQTIPSLFFPFLAQNRLQEKLADLRLLPSEDVAGEPCYVLTGTSPAAEETLWISETSGLLLRHSRSLRPGKMSMPKPSDEDLADAARKMEMTEESVQKLQGFAESTVQGMNDAGFSARFTETHSAIHVDAKLEPQDFHYPIPEGTVLGGFGDLLAGLDLPVPEPRQAPKPGLNLLAVRLRTKSSEVPASIRDRLLIETLAIPGVQDAALVDSLAKWQPYPGRTFLVAMRVPAKAEPRVPVVSRFVSPEYFRLADLSVLVGRSITDRDGQTLPAVALVSESLARRVWPAEEPVGKRFTVCCDPDIHWLTVVGVVADGSMPELLRPEELTVYRPLAQARPAESFVLLVRTEGDPSQTEPLLREKIARAFATELSAEDYRIVSRADLTP